MKGKNFILSLAMAIVAIGVSVGASTQVQSENVTINFNTSDPNMLTTTGTSGTSGFTTSSATYKEEHYLSYKGGYIANFVSKLISVTAWYLPNELRDTSTAAGTTSSLGWNEAYFSSGETLRSDMTAIGSNGTSMVEHSNTYRQN